MITRESNNLATYKFHMVVLKQLILEDKVAITRQDDPTL